MKVKILRSVMTASGALSPGAVTVIDDVIARSWIAAKLAVAIIEPSEQQVAPGPSEVKRDVASKSNPDNAAGGEGLSSRKRKR